MRIVLRLLLVLLLLAPSAYADSAPQDNGPKEIRIGALLWLTGELSVPSQAFRQGAELALELYAEHRGEGQPPIRLIFEDGRDGHASATAVRKLIEVDKVSALLLQAYADVMAAGPIIEKAGIPAITLWDANPEIDAAGEYIFAIGPWTPSSGQVSADFSSSVLQAKTAYIITQTDPWSESVATHFAKRFAAHGGQVLDTAALNTASGDFRSVLLKIKAARPDVIYAPLVSQIPVFYAQRRQLGIAVPVVASDVIAQEHIKQGPADFEGVYQTLIEDPSGPDYEAFAKLYHERMKEELTLPWMTAVGFDGMNLLIDAVKNDGASPKTIRDRLYQVKDYPGASTRLTISAAGSAPQLEKMFRIENGQFIPVL